MRLVAWQPDDLLRRLDDVVAVYGEAMGYRQRRLRSGDVRWVKRLSEE